MNSKSRVNMVAIAMSLVIILVTTVGAGASFYSYNLLWQITYPDAWNSLVVILFLLPFALTVLMGREFQWVTQRYHTPIALTWIFLAMLTVFLVNFELVLPLSNPWALEVDWVLLNWVLLGAPIVSGIFTLLSFSFWWDLFGKNSRLVPG